MSSDGVIESTVQVERGGQTVPLVVWRPVGCTTPAPGLVLLGHGGSGHKHDGRISGIARWIVSQAGLAAAAIDGPYHGERGPEPFTPAAYQALIAAEGAAQVVERMTGDWLAAIEFLGDRGYARTDRLGYFGLSMGARYGLPLAAALGDRLRCAVFGKFGLRQGPLLPTALDTDEITRQAAQHVTARTLFHVQWHDELFPRDGQLATFDLLGCADKRLAAYPGKHADAPAEAVELWRDFLIQRMN